MNCNVNDIINKIPNGRDGKIIRSVPVPSKAGWAPLPSLNNGKQKQFIINICEQKDLQNLGKINTLHFVVQIDTSNPLISLDILVGLYLNFVDGNK